ncbi:MAG: OmpA family protein [Myxococcota bacterium]|nr:OmpA family protein [Myxococcota bacterium]
MKIRIPMLALAACLALPVAAAADDEVGVTDFTRANPSAIESGDIADALAPNRAIRRPTRARLPIYFESDSATLTAEGRTLLSNAAGALKDESLEPFRFRIEGHTDSVGGAEYNQALSVRRAEAVRNFLIDQGVAPERLQAVGEGEDAPVASNDSGDGRQRNRRVEFVNLGPVE